MTAVCAPSSAMAYCGAEMAGAIGLGVPEKRWTAPALSLSIRARANSARRDGRACPGGGADQPALVALIGIKPVSGPPRDTSVIAKRPPLPSRIRA